jgi:hypothetical protein
VLSVPLLHKDKNMAGQGGIRAGKAFVELSANESADDAREDAERNGRGNQQNPADRVGSGGKM